MIIGIGTDFLDIRRLNNILKKYEKKFIDRIYGKNEIEIVNDIIKNSNKYYGKRFAAKEATWKALSPIRGTGLAFKEIETLNDDNGRPYLFFTGKTKIYIENCEKKLKKKLKFDISLTDDSNYVLAFVVISLAPHM